ncbi:MAG: molybdopterin cofactor-binding domain-containing protein [Candidatus Korobacteraceae bacterium]
MASAVSSNLSPAQDGQYASDLRFYVNGEEWVIQQPDPSVLLVNWLRSPEVGLTGTKKSCAQGGCGACTVMLSKWNAVAGQAEHMSVNACLRPLCSLDGMAITTTEGTGNSLSELSPVQYRIAKENGSQCGICTPGFVMNMHALLAATQNEPLSQQEIENIFDGNICRCTGYRSILYGMKHFAADWGPKNEEGCLRTIVDPAERVKYASNITVTFPSTLEGPPRAVHYEKNGYHWYRPLTLVQLHDILREHHDTVNVKLVVGNTSIGVYNQSVENPHVLVDISHVSDLQGIQTTSEGLVLGAATTYSDLLEELDTLRTSATPEHLIGIDALHYMVHRTAGTIVRNAASLAGNTMMVVRHVQSGEPFPSDAFTAYCSLGTRVYVSVNNALREYAILDYAREYQLDPEVRENGVLVRYLVPWTAPGEYARTYKMALRHENAHSIVNGGMRVRFAGNQLVEDAYLIYGGIGPIAFPAETTETYLKGRAWNADTLAGALAAIKRDVQANLNQFRSRMSGLPSEGFSDEYKIALAQSYFYQFYIFVAEQVQPGSVPPEVRSAGERIPRPVSTGHQAYEKDVKEYPVNLPYIKTSAFLQASGEAKYTEDLGLPPRGLAAAAVTSAQALAKFSYQIPGQEGARAATAQELIGFLQQQYPGFVDYVTSADIPAAGTNDAGGNDLIFATGQVNNFGQCIGLTLARSEELAIEVAQFISTQCIAYQTENLNPILTIQEARETNAIFPDVPPFPTHIWKVIRPHSDLAWSTADGSAKVNGMSCRVVHGQQQSGSQLHFYMEPQSCLALPGEREEITVHSSTQSPDSVHSGVSKVLGIPLNKVDVRVLRVGGGYGGKTTRSPFVASAAAVAAWKHRRPVKLVMRRENDSAMIGHRHAIYGEYAVAIGTGEDNPDHRGRLAGMKTDFWLNGGSTYDCSFIVMDCIQQRADSAYMVRNWATSGDVCQTNIASSTAFRSMGLVQALLVIEDAIEKAAHEIGMKPEEVRARNLYQMGQLTPCGQVVDYCYMTEVWERMRRRADFTRREAEVKTFNEANRWRKRGISMIPVKYGSGYNLTSLEQAGALVEAYQQDGTVLVRQGGVEIGQGLMIKVAQVAAKELNIPLALIEVADTDTQVVPNPISTGASTGSGFNAAAVKRACRQLRDRLEDFCLGVLRNNPSSCVQQHLNFWDYPDGWRSEITVNGETGALWKYVVKAAYNARLDLSAQVRFQQGGGTATDTGLVMKPHVPLETVNQFTGFTYSAACTEVEIDVLTGETTVLRADVLYDMGTSLNPAIDIGQVEGAFIQGLGYVLSEDVVFQPDGPNKGALNSDNTWRYKMPASTSIPIEFNVDLFPRSDYPVQIPENPYDLYSSKEVGEPPLVLAITAYFALKHAVLAARKDRGHDEWYYLEAPATVQRVQQACLVDTGDLTVSPDRPQAKPASAG